MDTNHSDFVDMLLERGMAVFTPPDSEDAALVVISFDNATPRVPPRVPPKTLSFHDHRAINSKNHDGETALLSLLHHRVNFSHSLLTWLLDLGADVNTAGRYGQTPLMAAISSKNLQVVRTLLQAGADVNDPDLYGRTPLVKVLDLWHGEEVKDVVDMLLDHGAVVKSELHFAITRRLHNVVDALIQSGSAMPRLQYLFNNKLSHVDASVPSVIKSTPLTPLFTAIMMGDLHLVRQFINLDFLNTKDLYPSPSVLKTILDYLQKRDSTETVQAVKKVYSQPWSLWTMSFVTVSHRIGFDSQRRDRLDQTGLPRPLVQLLMFRDMHH